MLKEKEKISKIIKSKKELIERHKTWCKNVLFIRRDVLKTFPRRKIKAEVSFHEPFFREDMVEVVITPTGDSHYKFTEKELANLYDWMAKYGTWREELDYYQNIYQFVTGNLKGINFNIKAEGRASLFCKVEREYGQRRRQYSYTRNSNARLVCT